MTLLLFSYQTITQVRRTEQFCWALLKPWFIKADERTKKNQNDSERKCRQCYRVAKQLKICNIFHSPSTQNTLFLWIILRIVDCLAASHHTLGRKKLECKWILHLIRIYLCHKIAHARYIIIDDETPTTIFRFVIRLRFSWKFCDQKLQSSLWFTWFSNNFVHFSISCSNYHSYMIQKN